MTRFISYCKTFFLDEEGEEGMEFLQVAIIVALVVALIAVMVWLFYRIGMAISDAGDAVDNLGPDTVYDRNNSNPFTGGGGTGTE